MYLSSRQLPVQTSEGLLNLVYLSSVTKRAGLVTRIAEYSFYTVGILRIGAYRSTVLSYGILWGIRHDVSS